jgi:SEC-C motif domain protein
MSTDPPCPCGLPARYTQCCGRFHAGERKGAAPDAEALMRSRYAAYTLQIGEYLLDTWHPSTRPQQAPEFEAGLRWLGLEIRRFEVQDADHATVEFIARSKLGGRAHRLHEKSRFVRVHGRWFYLDGEVS